MCDNPCFKKAALKKITSMEYLTPFEQTELFHEVEQKSFSTWADCLEFIRNRALEICGYVEPEETIEVDDEN